MRTCIPLAKAGFTLIELLVVMVIVSLLLTIAAPRYFRSVDKTKETVLRANLATTRDAIDKYYSDTGKYPDQLTDLVLRRYLRSMPWDPIVESNDAWLLEGPPGGQVGGIYDIHSSAQGRGRDGVPYAEW